MRVWAEGKSGVEKVRKKIVEYNLELSKNDPEIVIVWGGDGSVLRTARKHPHSCLLGLREKSIGQLAEIDGKRLDYALERLATNQYKIEKAPQIEVLHQDLRIHGLNEVYFSREYEYATRFRVFIDRDNVYNDELFGDGCLAATPRGSSAYSWTAGRKIVLKPNEKAFVFTPLSSGHLHKRVSVNSVLTSKPVEQIKVLENKEVIVEILRGGKNKFTADGCDEIKKYVPLRKGDTVVFRKSRKTSKFIRLFQPE